MDFWDEGILLRAGQRVPPGRYVRVDVPTARTLILEVEDYLPASCDGHIALYRPAAIGWPASRTIDVYAFEVFVGAGSSAAA